MQLRLLSNEDLHSDLQSTCGDHRKGLVEILRYLGEVDRRTLYARMGYRSLFAYCLKALKMSENEAGPRVAVARLAKEYPWVLDALAEGDVHLTGLSRLSAHMDFSNCLDLLLMARGKTVKEIDDLMAVRFPQPDVPELLRALPLRAPKSVPQAPVGAPRKSCAAERTIPMFDERVDERVLGSVSPPQADSTPTASVPATGLVLPLASGVTQSGSRTSITPEPDLMPVSHAVSSASVRSAASLTPPSSAMPVDEARVSPDAPSEKATPSSSQRSRAHRKEALKALSARRHAFQLTVSTELRRKLERARDLMSHRNRGGSFEAIVGGAVDLLLTKLERERLGKIVRKTSRPSPSALSSSAPKASAASTDAMTSSLQSSESASTTTSLDSTAQAATDEPMTSSVSLAHQAPTESTPAASSGALAEHGSVDAFGQGESTELDRSLSKPANQERRIGSRAIPRAVRREVFERDGEQCSFVSKAGVRCDARSLLEIDHVHPKALGGDDTVANTRLLCATHNRLTAEEAFGRDYVQKKIRQSQEARRQR